MKKSDIYKLLQYKKYQVIGSASNIKIKYPSDIDLQEFIYTNDTYLEVYEFFKEIYEEAYMNPDIYIIDFKLGFLKGKPIKWTYKDIKNGYVTKFDMNIPFVYALSQSSIIKLDVIALIDNVFTEFSYNYYFHFRRYNHSTQEKATKSQIENMLLYEYEKLRKQKKVYKSLKRLYSYYTLTHQNEKVNELETLFNSNIGKLYKQKSSIETMQLLVTNTFRKPPLEEVQQNLKYIEQQLPEKIKQDMKDIYHIKSLAVINTRLAKIVDKLNEMINIATEDWLKENK